MGRQTRLTTTAYRRPRTRPRNTKAVRRSRSTSTARSARRVSCATARRSSPSTAGSRTSARRTRSATIPNTGLHMTNWAEKETSDIKTSPACRSIRPYAGKIRSTSRQQNTSPRSSVSSSTTTGRRTTTCRPDAAERGPDLYLQEQAKNRNVNTEPAFGVITRCTRTRNAPSSSRCCWQRVSCWASFWASILGRNSTTSELKGILQQLALPTNKLTYTLAR